VQGHAFKIEKGPRKGRVVEIKKGGSAKFPTPSLFNFETQPS